MKIKLFCYFSLIFILSGCMATEDKYREYLDSWVGKTENELIQIEGLGKRLSAETHTGDIKNIHYYKVSFITIPATETKYISTKVGDAIHTTVKEGTPGRTIKLSCSTTFSIQNNVVVKWDYKGNDCVL